MDRHHRSTSHQKLHANVPLPPALCLLCNKPNTSGSPHTQKIPLYSITTKHIRVPPHLKGFTLLLFNNLYAFSKTLSSSLHQTKDIQKPPRQKASFYSATNQTPLKTPTRKVTVVIVHRKAIDWGRSAMGRYHPAGMALSSEVAILLWPGGSIEHWPRGTTVSEVVRVKVSAVVWCALRGGRGKVGCVCTVSEVIIGKVSAIVWCALRGGRGKVACV